MKIHESYQGFPPGQYLKVCLPETLSQDVERARRDDDDAVREILGEQFRDAGAVVEDFALVDWLVQLAE